MGFYEPHYVVLKIKNHIVWFFGTRPPTHFLSCFRHRVGLEHARLKARHLHLNLQHVEGAEGNAQAQTAEQAEQRAGMARGMRARKPHHFRLPHTRGWSGRFRPM